MTMGKILENDMAHAVETCLRNGFVMTGGFRIKDHLVGTANDWKQLKPVFED